jgi:YHS domain-containing protein
VQDPERYLRGLDIDPPCVVQPGKKSIIDSSMRVQMNYELYYFSSRAAMQTFKKNPLRYCGPLTDPITMTRFKPTAKSPKTVYLTRTYYFSADSTMARFLAAPDRYADRKSGDH